jgi:hypothetical protein
MMAGTGVLLRNQSDIICGRCNYGHDLPNHRLSLDLSGPGFDRCNNRGCALVFSAAGTDQPVRPPLVPEQPQIAAKFRARERAFLNDNTD